MSAQLTVDEFEAADAYLTEVLGEVEERLGGDLWDTLMSALDDRKSKCTAARNAVKLGKKSIGPFIVQSRGRNAWDHERAIELAKKRQELDDLVDCGVIKQTFDPKAAQRELGDAAFGIYKDDCHDFIKGASIAIQGPKPEDSILL